MQFFDVTIRCDGRGLAKVLETTNGVKLMTITPVQLTQGEVQQAKPASKYRGGKRFKGIKGRDLALQTLKSGNRPMSVGELGRVFTDKGFAAVSVYGVLSKLKEEGAVLALGDGLWIARGATIHMGATSNSRTLIGDQGNGTVG